MRDYAKIAPRFWIGATGKAIRKCGPEAQVVALYLLSSPHANMIGLYHLPIAYIAADTGIPFEGASKALTKLFECGFCGYDEDAEVVWVFEMAHFQIGGALKPLDKQCAGTQNAYDNVPENRFLPGFFDKYAGAFHMTSRREARTPFEAPSIPLRSKEQEQESEQEQEQERGRPAKARVSPAVAVVPVGDSALQDSCKRVWQAYASAYESRYGASPVRNAKVNGQVRQFVQRVGGEEGPDIAGWFPAHPGAFYASRMHDFGCLLSDAEKLRTEWATGRVMTNSKARQSDRSGATLSALNEILAERGEVAL